MFKGNSFQSLEAMTEKALSSMWEENERKTTGWKVGGGRGVFVVTMKDDKEQDEDMTNFISNNKNFELGANFDKKPVIYNYL